MATSSITIIEAPNQHGHELSEQRLREQSPFLAPYYGTAPWKGALPP